MKQLTLAGSVRQTKGKGAARKLRRQGQIPAVFYGPNTENLLLAVNYPELKRVLKQGISENILLDLLIETEHGTQTKKVMLKELQTEPVHDTYLHADFYEIAMDKEITLDIYIRLVNTPAGVTKGGVLQHVRRDVKVSCLPDKVIDSIDVDVSGLEIGESLHIEDIELPEGIRSSDDAHLTIAVVTAPTVIAAEAEEKVEEAEGEEKAAEEQETAE